MSTNQMVPVWMQVAGVAVDDYSMAADFVTDYVKIQFGDNVGIHVTWAGTPTGTIAIELSNDPDELGWEAITFTPTPDQPAGADGSDFFDLMQTAAGFVRMTYTFTSGTGTMKAKIAFKSV